MEEAEDLDEARLNAEMEDCSCQWFFMTEKWNTYDE
jgi:hypothetical protein